MPTPFYHLHMAESLLEQGALPDKMGEFLHAWRCAFLFGSTAPDVQVVSCQSRQATHFFSLPIQADAPLAWELMLLEEPCLAQGDQLHASHAAFLAGYLCHLQADWLWVKDIFAPTFGPRAAWGTFRERLYLHNVLRAYLDLHILPELRPGMDACLKQVEPDHWLPFVDDGHLKQWRNLLFPQLQPGAVTQTVEVFSSRGDVPAPEFYALLKSETRMQQEVFVHLPLQQVRHYQQRVLQENARLLSNYLSSTLHPLHKPVAGRVIQGAQP